MPTITPHLWYDTQAREAAEFYCEAFPESKVTSVTKLPGTPGGDTEVVSFTIWGHNFQAISAGPLFQFNPSISFIVNFDPSTMPDAREALTSLLQLHGADVVSVGSVSEALAEARRHAPDLLLSDIAMPDRDGYELLRELRSLPRFARLPAAALTAFAGAADRQRALAAGFQIHLAKPVEPEHLLSAVQSLVSAAAH